MTRVEPTARADLSRTWAIVPIRGLETAKTRLGEGLDAEERLDLVTDLLTRTLVATRDASRIAGTVVVTMDPAAAGLARDHRAIGLVERAPGPERGHRRGTVRRGCPWRDRDRRPARGPARDQRARGRRPRRGGGARGARPRRRRRASSPTGTARGTNALLVEPAGR